MAAQAVVAFLDESILNSQNPALRDWVRQPIGPNIFSNTWPARSTSRMCRTS
jgi:type VI protein secretion system component VasF